MNSAREYGAEFLSSAAGAWFDAEAVRKAVYSGAQPERDARLLAAAGADFAFTRDSSALVIAQRRSPPSMVSGSSASQPVYEIIEVHELIPTPGKPLSPGTTVREFATVCQRNWLKAVMADAHYRESIREHLERANLNLLPAPEGSGGKAESYTQFRTLLHDGRIKLPPNERLQRQLIEIVGQPTAGGGVSITSPRYQSGGHGDLVSACVLAVWQLARGAYTSDLPQTIGWSSRHKLNAAYGEPARDFWANR